MPFLPGWVLVDRLREQAQWWRVCRRNAIVVLGVRQVKRGWVVVLNKVQSGVGGLRMRRALDATRDEGEGEDAGEWA